MISTVFNGFYSFEDCANLTTLINSYSKNNSDDKYKLTFTLHDVNDMNCFRKLICDRDLIILAKTDDIVKYYNPTIEIENVSAYEITNNVTQSKHYMETLVNVQPLKKVQMNNSTAYTSNTTTIVQSNQHSDIKPFVIQLDRYKFSPMNFFDYSSINRIDRVVKISARHKTMKTFGIQFKLILSATSNKPISQVNEVVNYLRSIPIDEVDLYEPHKITLRQRTKSLSSGNIKIDQRYDVEYEDRSELQKTTLSDAVISLYHNVLSLSLSPMSLIINDLFDFESAPNVGILTSDMIRNERESDYVWLEKTDGLRTFLIIYDGRLFTKNTLGINEIELDPSEYEQIKNLKLCVFDTEYYNKRTATEEEKLVDDTTIDYQQTPSESYSSLLLKDGVFKIFDVYVYDGVSYMIANPNPKYVKKSKKEYPHIENTVELDYVDRMRSYHLDIKGIVVKPAHEIESWEAMLNYIQTTHIGGDSGDVIDGVIIQHRSKMLSYKLKPQRLITTDVLLMYNPIKSCYYMYLRTIGYGILNALKYEARHDKFGMSMFAYNNKDLDLKSQYYILFDIPHKNENYIFKPVADWDKYPESKQYTEEEREYISKTMNTMTKNPRKYNKKILEMSFDGKRWVPIRERFDKQNPNNYMVGLSNCGLLFAPLEFDRQIYFEQTKHGRNIFDDKMVESFKEVNQAIRTYIFDRGIINNKLLLSSGVNNTSTPKSLNLSPCYNVIDLACGRGGDVTRLVHSGCSNIFAIDGDRDALVTYIKKITTVGRKELTHVLPSLKPSKLPLPYLNVIHSMLTSDNTGILNQLNQRREYRPKSVDIIVMNYAIHYICDAYTKIIELKRLMNETLNENGVALITFYDGESMLNNYQNINSFNEHTQLENTDKIRLVEPEIVQSITSYLDDIYYSQVLQILDPVFINDENEFIDYIESNGVRVGVEFVSDKTKSTHKCEYQYNITLLINEEAMKKNGVEDVSGNYYMNVYYPKTFTQYDINLLHNKLMLMIDKKYKLSSWINMPLPTIDVTGYRKEPLVTNDYLEIFNDKFEILDDFRPAQSDDLLKFLVNNNIEFINSDYLTHIRTIVYKRISK